MRSPVRYSFCLVIQWLTRGYSVENSPTQPHCPLFFLLFFFFIIFKTNAKEGAETQFSPFQGNWKAQGQASKEQFFKSHCQGERSCSTSSFLHSCLMDCTRHTKNSPLSCSRGFLTCCYFTAFNDSLLLSTLVYLHLFSLKWDLMCISDISSGRISEILCREGAALTPSLESLTFLVPPDDKSLPLWHHSWKTVAPGVEHSSYLTTCTTTYTSV